MHAQTHTRVYFADGARIPTSIYLNDMTFICKKPKERGKVKPFSFFFKELSAGICEKEKRDYILMMEIIYN